MSRGKLLYEGKAKILYEGSEPGTLIQHFKDDTTAGNGEKHAIIQGKGVLNNRISEFLYLCLEEIGIHTHFIKSLNMREQLIKACEIIPIELVIRNVTAGSMAKRFGVEEGMLLPRPIIDFHLKSDKLGDPMITQEHIISFDWALKEELDEMKKVAMRVNDFLSGLFMAAGIKLVDMKLEFGRIYDEEGNLYIILADEISPDSCRLWDIETGDIMDKDRFRRDLGGLRESYQEIARRLGVLEDNVEEINFELNGGHSDDENETNTQKTKKSSSNASNNNEKAKQTKTAVSKNSSQTTKSSAKTTRTKNTKSSTKPSSTKKTTRNKPTNPKKDK